MLIYSVKIVSKILEIEITEKSKETRVKYPASIPTYELL